jgi:biotin carboxyl carrier protein
MSTTATTLAGERLGVPERLVLSPAQGVFRPLPPETFTTEGEIVVEGQTIGLVDASGRWVPVESRFSGFLMGLLAHPGERVRAGQPVAWLRVFSR